MSNFFRRVLQSAAGQMQEPPPPTPEERLLNAIFPTPENHPWPNEVQPMPGVKWRGDLDDYDWSSYVAECIGARTSTPKGLAEIAFCIAVDGELKAAREGDKDLEDAFTKARRVLQDHLDKLEGFGDAPES